MNEKKLLVIGGGPCQLAVIRRAKEMGHTVLVADYNPRCPGAEFADIHEEVSTFDYAGLEAAARDHGVDGIAVVGTDQPILSAARIGAKLGIPSFLTPDTAELVTDKKKMKAVLQAAGMPMTPYRILTPASGEKDLKGLHPPFVIKPLDSQGQRGVYKLNSFSQVREAMDEVLSFSKQQEVILEEFYPSREITVSGWVHKGICRILTATDRVTYHDPTYIGICLGHLYPSMFLTDYRGEIEKQTAAVTAAFRIENGPIYIQFLIGGRGLVVNEVAARIGGAYEDIFIPEVTGFDLLQAYIDWSLGSGSEPQNLPDKLELFPFYAAAQLFFLRPGTVAHTAPISFVEELPGVLGAFHGIQPGFEAEKIVTAGQRAGYVIILGERKGQLERRSRKAWKKMGILDAENRSMVLPFVTPGSYRRGH